MIHTEIEDYLEYCKNMSDKLSKNTIIHYKNWLYSFANIVGYDNNKSFAEITRQDIDKYTNALAKRDISKASFNAYTACVRSFFEYLVQQKEIIKVNAMRHVKSIKVNPSAKSQRSLTAQECDKLLDSCNTIRIKAVIQALLLTGMRVSELTNLTVDNLLHDSQVIRILNGKGDKDRTIPCRLFNVLEILDDYILNYRSKIIKKFNKKGYKYVFISTHGTQMQEKNVNNMIKTQAQKAKIDLPQEIHPHTFRHTFITNLLRQGLSLQMVAKIAGHSSVEMTSNYNTITNEDMEEAFINLIKKENK